MYVTNYGVGGSRSKHRREQTYNVVVTAADDRTYRVEAHTVPKPGLLVLRHLWDFIGDVKRPVYEVVNE